MRARFKARTSFQGFSLIELVVVIAILGILIAIALPNFLNVQKDAKINQAKNALATIVKECNVANLRGKSTALRNISSANGSLSGFLLSSQGKVGDDFLDSDCFKDVGGESKIKINAMTDLDSEELDQKDFTIFSITYDVSTGAATKTCKISGDTNYLGGCSASFEECTVDEFGDTQCPQGNGRGVW